MSLDLRPALSAPELLADPVAEAIAALDPEIAARIRVAPIDATLADTAAFCGAYGVTLEASANCIVVAGKRADTVTYAACVVLATTRADVNGAVRKLLQTRQELNAKWIEGLLEGEAIYLQKCLADSSTRCNTG